MYVLIDAGRIVLRSFRARVILRPVFNVLRKMFPVGVWECPWAIIISFETLNVSLIFLNVINSGKSHNVLEVLRAGYLHCRRPSM